MRVCVEGGWPALRLEECLPLSVEHVEQRRVVDGDGQSAVARCECREGLGGDSTLYPVTPETYPFL